MVGAAAERIATGHIPGFHVAAACQSHIATVHSLAFAKTDQVLVRIVSASAAIVQVRASAVLERCKTVVEAGDPGCAAVAVLLHALPQCYCNLVVYPFFPVPELQSHQ